MSNFVFAIDTSGAVCKLALLDLNKRFSPLDESTFCEIIKPIKRGMAEELPGLIEDLLRPCAVGMLDIRFAVCCMGPGSFTGLRTGMSFLNGWATASALTTPKAGERFCVGLSAFAAYALGSVSVKSKSAKGSRGDFKEAHLAFRANRQEFFTCRSEIVNDTYFPKLGPVQVVAEGDLPDLNNVLIIDEPNSTSSIRGMLSLICQFQMEESNTSFEGFSQKFQEHCSSYNFSSLPICPGGFNPMYVKRPNALTMRERGLKQ